MKQRTFLFGAIMGFLLLGASCIKDPFGSNLPSGNFTARINGEKFDGATETAILTQGPTIDLFAFSAIDVNGFSLIGNNDILGIYIYIPSGSALSETEYSFSGEVDCDLSPGGICGVMGYGENIGPSNNTDAYYSAYEGGSFTIKFTSIDYRPGGHAKGSFSGELVNEDTGEKLEVKNGAFDLDIQ